MRGDRLKLLREQAGYTQEALAELLGRDIKQIWRWESGKVNPTSDAIVQLSNVFKVSSDFLLGLSNTPTEIIGAELYPPEVRLIHIFRGMRIRDQFLITGLMRVMIELDAPPNVLKDLGEFMAGWKEDEKKSDKE